MTRAAPFVMIVSAFAAGIWLAAQFALPVWASGSVAALALIVTYLARRQPDTAWAAGCVMLLAAGACWHIVRLPPTGPDTPSAYNGHILALEGMVVEEPDARERYVNLRVQAWRLVGDSADARVSGLVLVRAPNDTRWRYGDVIRAFGKMDAPPVMAEFDYREYLARKNILSWMSYPLQVRRIDAGKGNWLYAGLLDLKDALRQSSQRIMPSPESALLNGILIGDDNEIPSYIQDAFRVTGTSHIVAISGFNVSIVIALVVPVLGRLLNKRRAALVAIPAIVVYTILVGASASVQRAAAMAILALIGQLLWRRGFTLNTLCAAAFFMLLYEPDTLFDFGFQLSFAATLGLVLYANRLASIVHEWLSSHIKHTRLLQSVNAVVDILSVTIAALIVTQPLLLNRGYVFSLTALIANLIVVPLQPAAMILGIIASVSGALSMPAGSIVGLLAYGLLTATLRTVQWMSECSRGVQSIEFGTPAVITYYLALLCLTALANQTADRRQTVFRLMKKHLGVGTVLVVTIALLTAGGVYWYQRPDGKLHVTLVGEGAFIQTPSGKQVVFAGGGGVLPVMGRAMPLWDKGVELLILPQDNDTNRSNTLPILQRYKVGTVIQPDHEDNPSAMSEDWREHARIDGVRVISPPIGTRAVIEPGVVLTIEQHTHRNGHSAIGARLSYGNTTFELVGDADIISGTLDGADVIFVSVDGGPIDVLNAAQPRYVVWADAGGAPHQLDSHIRAFALRDAGMVEFVSDGATVMIR